MRERRLHHRRVQKDVVISIASAVRLISVHVIQISIVQRQVVFTVMWFQHLMCVFVWVRYWFSLRVTRRDPALPPLYLPHSTA